MAVAIIILAFFFGFLVRVLCLFVFFSVGYFEVRIFDAEVVSVVNSMTLLELLKYEIFIHDS